MMGKPGLTVSRWIDGVMEKNENIDQDSKHPRDGLLGPRAELADPRPGHGQGDEDARHDDRHRSVSVGHRRDGGDARGRRAGEGRRGVYLLPAATQFETEGSCTASNRSLQWREKVIDPCSSRAPTRRSCWPSRENSVSRMSSSERRTAAEPQGAKAKGGYDEPSMEDALANEINRGAWTIGYTGQSPERLKAHMKMMHVFDVKTLRAKGGKYVDPVTKKEYDLTGDYFGLPCVLRHAGAQAPGLAEPLRHLQARHGRRRKLPRDFRHGKGRG